MIYKKFFLGETPFAALGDLAGDLGDELRAFKKNGLPYPDKIFSAFTDVYRELELNCDALIYIPSHEDKIMSFFLHRISQLLHIPVMDQIRYVRATSEQKFLPSRTERQDNVCGAFSLTDGEALRDKDLLLVDDVYASGETLKEVLALLARQGIFPRQGIVFAYRNDFNPEP